MKKRIVGVSRFSSPGARKLLEDAGIEAVEADLDLGVSGLWALREVARAARAAGRAARIQLKADTGLGRNGCQPGDWPESFVALRHRRSRR